MKLEVTKAQLEAIKSLTDDCAAMIGGGCEEADRIWIKHIQLIDRMLRKNGHERYFNSQGCNKKLSMTVKKYKCHDCEEETKIVPKYSELSNRHGFMIMCPHCHYEAGLFSTVEDAEFVINSNLSQGCNKRNEYKLKLTCKNQ